VVERNRRAEFWHRKSRFEELGYPTKLKMTFDLSVGRYRSADYETTAGLNRYPAA
jgi:twinkle protein